MLEDAEEGKKLVAPKTRGRGVGCVLHDRCPDSGTAPDGGVGHPFAAQGAAWSAATGVVVGEVNQWGRPRRLQSGVMTWTTRAHHRLGAVSCRRATRRRCRRGARRVEGADVVITQPVEDQG